MKKNLKKYGAALITLSFAVSIIFLMIQHSKIEHLNSRLDTVNKNFQKLISVDNKHAEDTKFIQFKEESYLRQLDRDTTLILWFIAIVAGLFGIVSFSSINRRIVLLEDNLEKNYTVHFDKVNKLTEELLEIKSDLNSESYTINSEKAESFKREKDYNLFVFYTLVSVDKLVQYQIYHSSKNNTELADATLESIKINVKRLCEVIKDLPTKPSISKNTYGILDRKIRSLNDLEINEFLSKIHTLIQYK